VSRASEQKIKKSVLGARDVGADQPTGSHHRGQDGRGPDDALAIHHAARVLTALTHHNTMAVECLKHVRRAYRPAPGAHESARCHKPKSRHYITRAAVRTPAEVPKRKLLDRKKSSF
jgi:hypothetical protein